MCQSYCTPHAAINSDSCEGYDDCMHKVGIEDWVIELGTVLREAMPPPPPYLCLSNATERF